VVNFTPRPLYSRGKSPGSHWIGGWVDPRAGLEKMEKKQFLKLQGSNSKLSDLQAVASPYTDCAIPAPLLTTRLKISARHPLIPGSFVVFLLSPSQLRGNVHQNGFLPHPHQIIIHSRPVIRCCILHLLTAPLNNYKPYTETRCKNMYVYVLQ
jgi:hypothetical protein